ncbi:amidohydrolase family protein [Arthrobacter sp. Leaf137]|uniref:amidohydrolase family protein n=1 Tax=Arthrobacter sp. Leaf137 TaxID=1736271 RepID=UPI00138ED268|nr:amidohydrolase family protein [Arthrobacter sp. Leaf137]
MDSHVHIGTSGVPLGPAGPAANFALWRKRAAAVGIRRAVLMAAPVGSYAAANRMVATLARQAPDRWLWYVFVNAATERGLVGDVVAEAHARGACGIKVHWSDGPATDEVGVAAQRHRMPVLFDPGGDVQRVVDLAGRHPDVAWIVPHLSSFTDDWRAQSRLTDALVRMPNIFADTSGVRYFDLLEEAVARAGSRKVLYGSDGPYLHPAPELAKIFALNLPRADRALILGGNVLRLTRPARRAGGRPNYKTPVRRTEPWASQDRDR